MFDASHLTVSASVKIDFSPMADEGANRRPAAGQGKSPYTQFLDRLKQPSTQTVVNDVKVFVNDFPSHLTRPQAARKIHTFITEAVPKLLETPAFLEEGGARSEDAEEQATEGLERFIILKLYKLLFRHAPADLREDESVDACIRSKGGSSSAELPTMSAQSSQMFDAACQELQKVEQYRAPRDKVVCLLNAYRAVEGIVDEAALAAVAGPRGTRSGQLRDFLTALMVRAAPPNMFSNVEFADAFRHPRLVTPEEKQCLTDWSQAIAFLTDEQLPPPRTREQDEASSDTSAEAGGHEGGGGGAFFQGGRSTRPAWLKDAGITFHFEDRAADELLVGETEELLDEYHRMVRALRELSGVTQDDKETMDNK